MRADPARRNDGRCALVSCRKKLRPATPVLRRYAGAQIDVDPFCSTECCRAWHRVPEREGKKVAR